MKSSKAKEEAAIARAARVANELADKMAQIERQESSRSVKEREMCDLPSLVPRT